MLQLLLAIMAAPVLCMVAIKLGAAALSPQL
jgi:hypothetical protein